MWMYRRMMRISFSQHMSNEGVLRKVEADRNLIKNTRKRQLEFLVIHCGKMAWRTYALLGSLKEKEAGAGNV